MSRLDALGQGQNDAATGSERRTMIGSGMRGDKIRTIRIQADEAVDHASGKRIRATEYLGGNMDMLWK